MSVSDKTGLVDLGRGLVTRGFDLVSTGGTARVLAGAGLPVIGVADVTGFPEMMDGRVKTLHPALHGGILARRERRDDLAALERHGIDLIDLVVVNLYPFAQAAADPATPFDALVEEIDIGGPSLIRAAAKNFRSVLVVVEPGDYQNLLSALDSTTTLDLRFALMRKAFAHTARYDAMIAATLGDFDASFERRRAGTAAVAPPADGERAGNGTGLATRVETTLEKIRDLRYGENPHQKAAWYRPTGTPIGFGAAEILQGKDLSYTNLLDLDAAARIVLEFDEPAAAVIKHSNPCGAAAGTSLVEAYVRARDADSLAAYGGIVGLNRPIDVATADAVVSTFVEAVVAPSVDPAARRVLAKRTNMRVVTSTFSRAADAVGDGISLDFRSILGAMLAQQRDEVLEARAPWRVGAIPDGLRVVTRRQPTDEQWQALSFAWRICAYVKSNAVVFTDRVRTLAIGAGQMSRVDAVKVAVMKAAGAGVLLTDSVAASDAFFPFRDGLDEIAKAGASAVVQPGGSMRDAEVIAAADEHGLAMVFTGRRHFRH